MLVILTCCCRTDVERTHHCCHLPNKFKNTDGTPDIPILYNYYYCTCFNGLFSRTTWLSCYQKGKTNLDLNEARDNGVLRCSGISWTTCKQSAPRCRQITTPTSHHSIYIFTGQMLFKTPNRVKALKPKYTIQQASKCSFSHNSSLSVLMQACCMMTLVTTMHRSFKYKNLSKLILDIRYMRLLQI